MGGADWSFPVALRLFSWL